MTKDPLQRSKAACVRCKNRKTKCSGTTPCETCVASEVECIYTRKPKKIKVNDTELEALRARIEELENRQKYGLEPDINKISTSPSPDTNSPRAELTRGSRAGSSHNDLNLSILLSSPSCELITWNLTNFLSSKNSGDSSVTVTPEFSPFMEADCYDSILYKPPISGSKAKIKNCYELLKQTDMNMVKEYLYLVVKYINVGYLILDPAAFEHQLPNFYTAEGELKPLPQTGGVDYFILKILLIIALGLIYHPQNCIGVGNPKLTDVPGLRYFKVAMHLLPANHQLLNFGMNNFRKNLQTIEIYGLMAVYSRILDKKNLSCFFTMSALQLGVSMNLHKRSMITKSRQSDFSYSSTLNYNTKIFWSIFCLNRFYNARIGQPVLLSYKDISLPQDHLGSDLHCYVELGKISELINREIYNDSSFNTKNYFNTLFYILSLLKTWTNELPPHLVLDFKKADSDVTRRSLASLHLNQLHHVYLTCIPIFLHFAKMKIFSFRENKDLNYLKLTNLPQNVQDFFLYCIKSSQLTVTVFVKLLDRRLIRAFGSVELDFLYSSALVFFICILLNFDEVPVNYDFNRNFEENFLMCITFMRQMALMGNLVAEAKVKQIVDMAEQFDVILQKSRSSLSAERIKQTSGNTSKIKDYSTAALDETDYRMTNNDNNDGKPLHNSDQPLDLESPSPWEADDQIFGNIGFLNNQDLDSLLDTNTGTGSHTLNQFANITDDDLNFMSSVLHEFDTNPLFS